MRNSRIRCALLAAFASFIAGPSVSAATTAAEAAAHQQASLNGILTTYPARAITAQRMTCMLGEEPDRVTDGRRSGKDFMPDAADTCVAVLVRTAHDGHLPDLYRTLVAQLGGSTESSANLPLAIGKAALDGNGQVALGNGKVIDVPAPLAFDAGFTAAYMKGDTRAGNADPKSLKLLTEACLGVRKDAGTCFSAGYAQGGRALNAGP